MVKKADSCGSVFDVSGYVNAPLASKAAAIIFPVPKCNFFLPVPLTAHRVFTEEQKPEKKARF